MIAAEQLRRRIDQEFTGECHLTSDEARLLFDVYEAACTWSEVTSKEPARRDLVAIDAAADRLIVAVDAARSAPCP